MKVFNASGFIMSMIPRKFSAGPKNGIGKDYYKNGVISGNFVYKDDKIIIKKYFYKNGDITFCENNKGKKTFEIRFHEEGGGFIYKTGKTIDGYREGICRRFYKNGIQEWETPYTNGNIEGIEYHYLCDGVVSSDDLYIGGSHAEFNILWK